jgi:hypothetical protein
MSEKGNACGAKSVLAASAILEFATMSSGTSQQPAVKVSSVLIGVVIGVFLCVGAYALFVGVDWDDVSDRLQAASSGASYEQLRRDRETSKQAREAFDRLTRGRL